MTDRNHHRRRDSLSIGQLATRWAVGPERVRALINAGELPAFRVPAAGRYGAALRVRLLDVERAEREWSARPTPPATTRRRGLRHLDG